ncbi:DUF2235 domain-containing protein [Mycobacterium sp. SMC-4]|uniref:phospholipase effector Tle1 domain-containing protein n=1 Tax=Mycobacterium sp. SMC-4 TaxID=2857059 RepID=UPI0021B34938|nr:DUF2235 domain-containing protein [Mycobacterium sp. SMC-4]
MKNIVLCFDDINTVGNAAAVTSLLHRDDSQLIWTRPDDGRRPTTAPHARAVVAAAYEFLVDHWQRGDRIFMFGTAHAAFCARALARLLGTVGVVRTEFRDWALSAYAMPRTSRSAADWRRVGELAAQLAEDSELAVDVEFLGLWDTVAVRGVPRADDSEVLVNVVAARHAVAIDGGYGRRRQRLVPAVAAGVEEVWFRGGHRDVTGAAGADAPLSAITLDWVLDGAMKAGVLLAASARHRAPAPSVLDALAGAAHPVPSPKVPADATVHASVHSYLRAHPGYWRRLPGRVHWADLDWAARGERLCAVGQSSPAVLATTG